MKFEQFRSPLIRERLHKATERWQKAESARRLEKPSSSLLRDQISSIVRTVLLLLPLIALFFSNDGGFLLSLILPVLAGFVAKSHAHYAHAFLSYEPTYLLPITDRQLDQQILRNSSVSFFKGLTLAILYGIFSSGFQNPIRWGVNSGLIYLGLLAFLSLSWTRLLRHLSSLTFYGFGALAFVYLISDKLQTALLKSAPATLWLQAFTSWFILIAFLGLAFITAWIIRKKWLTVAPWDRSFFYQYFGGGRQAMPSSDKIEVTDLSPKTPRQPLGIFEKHLWRKLTPKERAVFRAAGGTQSNFLRAWLITTALVVAWAWLVSLNLFPRVKIFQPVLFIGFTLSYLIASTLFWKLHWISQSFSGAVETSSRALAAVFHTIPLGIRNLEKLHWKEGLYRWPLMTLTIVIGFNFLNETYFSTNFIFCFLYLLPLVILAHTMMFWVARVKDWFPPIKHHGLRLQLTSFVVFIFTLITTYLACQIPFEIIRNETSFNPTLLISTALVATLGIALLRQLVLPYIANPRRDLMKQS